MWGVIPVSCLPSGELPELDERVLAGGQDVLPVAGEGDGGDGRAVVRLQEGRHAPDGSECECHAFRKVFRLFTYLLDTPSQIFMQPSVEPLKGMDVNV